MEDYRQDEESTTIKRMHTSSSLDNTISNINSSHLMISTSLQTKDNITTMAQLPPLRPSTPPLGMTLSHYNPTTGSYTASQLNVDHEVKSKICTGMTPVYRAPFERWGSCLI
ncbi:uncharacterized protein BX663DRAFT_486699 [Cokeromyces recurvatus]|uniref:uncharacterized protein n=1 Tax=Cokeromyces recurvatus TaxID=90255 RepID=UPI00221F27F6|nr:uncharacterized protein BX663DRAFT_486699 [Cokeromyces recurvatus]KAI7902385.1 hypothetical protein BX663DRAFT_486699 [Cokeromyces recurvatus]